MSVLDGRAISGGGAQVAPPRMSAAKQTFSRTLNRAPHGTERGPAHSDGRREYKSREVRGDDRNVDATRYRGGRKTYPILAGAHKAERGARYCSAHGVSQYTVVYIAMRHVVNSCVARNADIGGRTTLSPSPEAAESARRTQRRSLFALRASRKSDARTFQSNVRRFTRELFWSS